MCKRLIQAGGNGPIMALIFPASRRHSADEHAFPGGKVADNIPKSEFSRFGRPVDLIGGNYLDVIDGTPPDTLKVVDEAANALKHLGLPLPTAVACRASSSRSLRTSCRRIQKAYAGQPDHGRPHRSGTPG